MLNKLLEYQKVDSKLVKIEKDLENSDSKGVVNNMVRLVREAQNHLIQIERSAGELIAEYKHLVEVYEKEKKCIAELKDKEVDDMNAFELREENSFVTKQISDVVGLKKSITALSKKIIQKLNEFEKTRKQGVESKKKYDSVVNKRRTSILLQDAYSYFENREIPEKAKMNRQVMKEIDYIMNFYNLKPKVFISYDRFAFFEKNNSDFRLTVDKNIQTRRTDLHLNSSVYGDQLLEEGQWLMEAKAFRSFPLWFVQFLSERKIYSTSFSKYGAEYKKFSNNQK